EGRVDFDPHRGIERRSVIFGPTAVDLESPLLCGILHDLVEQACEKILEARLSEHARDKLRTLLRPVYDRLDADHGRTLKGLRVQALCCIAQPSTPLEHVIEKLDNWRHLLAEKWRRGVSDRRRWIAAHPDHRAQFIVEGIVDVYVELIDRRLGINRLRG